MNTVRTLTTFLSIIGSAIFIGLSFDVDDSLIRFLIVGEIPGSNVSLSPDTMLLVLGTSFALLCLVMARPVALLGSLSKLNTIKTHLPKHRYSSIQ